MRYTEFGKEKRGSQHYSLHDIVLFHGEMFHRINVLYSGYIGKKFDLPTTRCLGNGMLHFIGEKEFERVGCTSVIPVDFRLIAATNQNLEHMVSEGDALRYALALENGNKAQAAMLLGIHRTLLYKKMKKHGMPLE